MECWDRLPTECFFGLGAQVCLREIFRADPLRQVFVGNAFSTQPEKIYRVAANHLCFSWSGRPVKFLAMIFSDSGLSDS